MWQGRRGLRYRRKVGVGCSLSAPHSQAPILTVCGQAGPTCRKKVLTGTGEMAQQLRTLATLPENLGWILSKHVSPHSVTPLSRDPKSSSGIHRYPACNWCRQMCGRNTQNMGVEGAEKLPTSQAGCQRSGFWFEDSSVGISCLLRSPL